MKTKCNLHVVDEFSRKIEDFGGKLMLAEKACLKRWWQREPLDGKEDRRGREADWGLGSVGARSHIDDKVKSITQSCFIFS